MTSVNKVILVGNVGSDPDVRTLERGGIIVSLNLATTERGYTMQNGIQVPDRTEWHSIVLRNNLADWAERSIRKGMKLYVEGKLQTRSWEKDGQIRRKTEVIAENVQILYRPEQYRRADGLQVNNEAEEAAAAADSAQEEPIQEQRGGFFNNIF
jgi:single-strand DNA-binding protein